MLTIGDRVTLSDDPKGRVFIVAGHYLDGPNDEPCVTLRFSEPKASKATRIHRRAAEVVSIDGAVTPKEAP